MTSLIELLIASFLAMATPAPAAPAATQAPAAGKSAEARQKAEFKAMLDKTRKVNDICTRDHFGKACIAAQETFQRKFYKQMPPAQK